MASSLSSAGFVVFEVRFAFPGGRVLAGRRSAGARSGLRLLSLLREADMARPVLRASGRRVLRAPVLVELPWFL